MGQAHPVQVIHMLTEGSIEERVWETMRLKRELFSGLFDLTADEVSFEKLGRSNMMKVVKEVMDEGPEKSSPSDPQPEPEPVALAEDTAPDSSGRKEPEAPLPGVAGRASAPSAAGGGRSPASTPRPTSSPPPASGPPSGLEGAVAGLFEAGLRFLEAFATPTPTSTPAAGQAAPGQRKQSSGQGGLAGLVRTDPETNGRVMAIPLPESVDAERIEQAVGGLLRKLAGGS